MIRGLHRVRLLVWAGIAATLVAGGGLMAQGPGQGQQAPPPPPPINLSDDPLLRPFVWRAIGPANMGGRIDDIAVDEKKPSTYYLGFAGGGLWKTTNNGTTFTPIFDKYRISSIGDIAIAPSNSDIVYVGTGEPNNRQSSTLGGGMYKSTDGGKEFEYIGLKETQSIARVVVHPKDPNTVYVAAMGHLFGPNKERGLYKSTDGGKNWTNTKFIDEHTGFTEVVMHPTNPNVLWAASYQRLRQPWGFNGGGAGSAIWTSNDGAKTWTKVTGNGLPNNPIIGRIGMDISRSNPNVIMASIEVGPSGGTGAGVNADGSLAVPGQGRGGGGGGGRGGEPAKPDPTKSGIWRSDDGGKKWSFLSNDGDRWMYYSQIRIDPTNPQIAYQGGAPFFKTTDGGKTWQQIRGVGHSDHHAIWINPRDNNHILLGNDGGLDISYDQGATWDATALMPLGQFYAISADMQKPYLVCGGLQDNGSWCGPSAKRGNIGILNSDWFRVGGGDGFYTAQDPTDWTVIYSESQDGNTNRSDLRAGRSQSIRPRAAQVGGRGAGANLPAGVQLTAEQQAQLAQLNQGNVVPPMPAGTNFRFFWSTPFMLSPHNPRTVYLGAERLFRSYDRGDTWTASPDLTRNIGRNDRPIMGVAGTAPMASKHDGAASYSNIITISESSVVPGILWVGTNDGNAQVSRDGGTTWKNVIEKIPGAPKESHISRVEASHFDAATAYVTIDNHRLDDHKPYIFKTTDYGETWTSVAGNMPEGNVNVIREDPKNRNLLYVGTEYGFYVSLNGGKEWKPFMNGLPWVRVDDILIHPRENDLIIGTHGRSIWIIDDITPLQQLSDQVMTAETHVFDVRPAVAYVNDVRNGISTEGQRLFSAENPERGSAISYMLKGPAAGDVTITVHDITGREVRSMPGPKVAGLHRVLWNPSGDGGGRGRGGQGGGAQQVAAPAAVPPAAVANQQQSGQQAAAQAAQQAAGRGGVPTPQINEAQQQQPAPQQVGRGGGRGGGGGAVPPGTYLVRVKVGDKVIGEKTVTVEADTTFMR